MDENKKEESLYSQKLKEIESDVRESEKKAWRSVAGNEPLRFRDDSGSDNKIDYRELLKNNNVKAGAVAMVLGLLIAVIGLSFDLNTTWRMIICLTAATFSTAGARTIESVINELGYKEIKEMNDFNNQKNKLNN